MNMQKKLRLGDHTLCQGRLDSLDCHCSDTESEAGDTLEVIQVTIIENIRNGNYRRDIYCVAADCSSTIYSVFWASRQSDAYANSQQ